MRFKHWRVENGELVNDGFGTYLTTEKEYGDIELMIDYKTVPKADSGIYLRGTPQVQIWDYTEEAKFGIGADKGSGGLWNNSPGSARQGSAGTGRQAVWRVESVPHPSDRRAHDRVSQRQTGGGQRDHGELLGSPSARSFPHGTDPAADTRRRDPLAEHLRA